MTKQVHVSNPSMKIPIHCIIENHDFNCRKINPETEDYDKIADLAKQIKNDGLLSPVMVREIPEDRRDEGQLESYELVFGFRRMAAVRSLGQDSIMAQIWEGKDEDMYFINLAENISREDLEPWEKAMRYSELKNNLGISGGQIAARLGIGKGHVNNLIRIIEEGNPKIIALWKQGHGKAKTDALIKKVILKEANHDEQWENWLVHADLVPESEGPPPGEDDGEPKAKPEPTRQSKKHLENALNAAKGNEKHSEEYLSGVVAALKWATV